MSKHDETTPSARKSRRGFLKGAAVATAAGAALAMPQVSRAQTVSWKFQSTWPSKDIFHEFAADYAKAVTDLSGGRLKLELLQAGQVVPAFQLQDAVNRGLLDGGHGVSAYWYGKHKAFSMFGTTPPWFHDANSMLGWLKYGGGQKLYEELINDILKLNVVGYLTGPMPTQPLGWFKTAITSADQIKNLKYRTVGLSADLFKAMGAAVTILPGGEIVPAMERGVLDAAEFNNPSSDKALGFQDVSKVYMMQSYHQAVECFEVIFNKQKVQGLPKELQSILAYAAEAHSSDMLWKAFDRYSKDMEELTAKSGVKITRTPDAVLQAQLKAWDVVLAEQTKEPFFKKVVDSQKAWAKRVGAYWNANNVAPEPSYKHFFG